MDGSSRLQFEVVYQAIGAALIDQLGGGLVLAHDEVEDLAARIDAQRDGRELLGRIAGLSGLERKPSSSST